MPDTNWWAGAVGQSQASGGEGGSRSGLIAWPWASPHPFGGLGFPLFKAQLDGAYTGRIKRESA